MKKDTSQIQEFAKGLQALTTDFKEDSQQKTDEYNEYVKNSGTEFQDVSHEYAQTMMQRSNQYLEDMADLYESIYGENPLEPQKQQP